MEPIGLSNAPAGTVCQKSADRVCPSVIHTVQFDAAGHCVLPNILRSITAVELGDFATPDPSVAEDVKAAFPFSSHGAKQAAPEQWCAHHPEPQDPARVAHLSTNSSPLSAVVGRAMTVGVVLLGGPAPGAIDFLCGLRLCLHRSNTDTLLVAYVGGPDGFYTGSSLHVDAAMAQSLHEGRGLADIGAGSAGMFSQKHSVRDAMNCIRRDRLSGLVFVGGWRAATDAAELSEACRAAGVRCAIVVAPKRAEGVRARGVNVSFGFDSVTKVYSQLLGNLCADAASTQASYHFVRVMGETASQLVLETALQAHPNVTMIGEEVRARQRSLDEVVTHMVDIICARARKGKHYGVVLIPEGFGHFIVEVENMLGDIETLLLAKVANADALLKPVQHVAENLPEPSRSLFARMPAWLCSQLVGDSWRSSAVSLSTIQVERFFAEMCAQKLADRAVQGSYVGKFAYNCHFLGYEARSCAPSALDSAIGFSLGHAAAILVERGITGVLVTLGHLSLPQADWTASAVPIVSLLTKAKKGQGYGVAPGSLVVETSEVSLDSYAFQMFKRYRDVWAVDNYYRQPAGAAGHDRNITLALESLQACHTRNNVLPHFAFEDLSRRFAAMCIQPSPFVLERRQHAPDVPLLLRGIFSIDRSAPSALSGPDGETLMTLFPLLASKQYNHVNLVPHSGSVPVTNIGRPLTIGIVLSGGPAPGGHNVIAGLFDFLKGRNMQSRVIGFKNGPTGLLKNDWIELTEEKIAPVRNQGGFHLIGTSRTKIEKPEHFAAAAVTCENLRLDGLVVCGGDDSNTNAALLAEHFLRNGIATSVVGVPKTIDADLRNGAELEMSFGFDTCVKLYSQMVANIEMDAATTRNTWHFIRLMGRAASHITLEVALQVHPNYTAISEEVEKSGKSIAKIVQEIVDLVEARAAAGKNYGVVLIPEGLVEFTSDMKEVISQLNEVLATHASQLDTCTDADERMVQVGQLLSPSARATFEFFPPWLRLQLLGDRDPHGNVRVSQIQSERLLGVLVAQGIAARQKSITESKPRLHFRFRSTFMGYQGRCGMVSNFDCSYCYTLGFLAGALVDARCTGYIAAVQNLTRHPEQWRLSGVPLISLMNIERRKGHNVPVIEKKLVSLNEAPFKAFSSMRQVWSVEDHYPTRAAVATTMLPTSSALSHTLCLEAGESGAITGFKRGVPVIMAGGNTC